MIPLLVHLAAAPGPATDPFATTLATDIKPLIQDAITVMQVVIPLIAIFRIVYKFAESREGSLTVLIAEAVLIVFLAFGIGQLLKLFVSVTLS